MKLLATKKPYNATLPPPPPTIRVGYMKRRFFHAFLCLILSGCFGGGGGGSDSGASSKKKVKACTPLIANGKGGLLWNKATKKYSTTCKVISCNSGFVKNSGRNSCDIPDAGKYANNKGAETACTPIEGQGVSQFNKSTGGVSSATACPFSCGAGYFKNGRSCKISTTGKYVHSSGSEKSCSTPTGVGFKNFSTNTGAVTTVKGCNFECKSDFVISRSDYSCKEGKTCNITKGKGFKRRTGDPCQVVDCDAGYDNDVDSTKCQQTASGYYSLVDNKERIACPTPSNSSPTGTLGLTSPNDCWNCNSGYLKNIQGTASCKVPSKGNYVNAQGSESSCNPIGIEGAAIATWIVGAAATAATCPFSCTTGYVKSGRACKIPAKGQYADNGVEKSCFPITGDTYGFDDFAVNTGAVTAANGCGFSCNAGFVKDSSDRECNYPSSGNYVTAQGTETSCNSITLEGTATSTWIVGAADDADACPFSCTSGYLKDASTRECNYPSTGNYVTAGNIENACNSITIEGTAVATWQEGAAATDTACPFSCTAGYLKDSSARECKYPTLGHYVNASGAEVGCTDISGMTGLDSWLIGAATDEDSCPFSCDSGYTISGRTCRQPEMLALGENSSRVLFSTGEVEAWGKVSNRKWRTHLKEDLGSHTPQALAAGDFHQCIILKNATLNHGRLMCWGQNSNRQLGVGDTTNKATPIAVTASVLGHTGDGATPKTVKSVAAGYYHTCALLNDDTVKCWGQNANGQIGGGSGGTTSGTVGDPLSGTANRIAAGWFMTCAVLSSDSSVQCWGKDRFGETGGGTPSLGVGKTATEIAIGSGFACAILDDGSVKCWGHTGPPALGGKTATKIVLGYGHGCVFLTDKTVKCWGSNSYGQVGGGTAGSDQVLRGTVGDPLGGQTAIEIAAGSQHTCAIMESDNSVKCWGLNTGSSGSYGQIVGKVAMTGGSDGTGTSTGETATLTAVSTPTATSLDSDEDGEVCVLEFSGGNLRSSIIIVRDYMMTGLLKYNTGSSTDISTAIDNLIAVIGSPMNIAGTNVTLSKSGSDKIAATADTAIFSGMTLAIHHDNNGGDCFSTVRTDISLSGGSGGVKAKGLWVISNDYTGSGDKTINLDSVHIDLGNSNLSKENIADKIVADVAGASWLGKQYKDLPYTATKLDGSSSTTDDCPDADFCVVFNRVFKGTEGNYGIPFGDRDYEH